jgi:glycosyltransferase involved in cell wall biosynthesis
VVCDDGSVDNTYEVADSAGANVIRHEKNFGKGKALQSLFKFARHSNFDVIVTIDGDGQFLPDEIPKLVKKVESGESDIVIGYRFDDTTEMPNYRKFGNKMLDKMANMVSELSVSDTQSGFRAYSKNIIKLIDFKKNGFGADTEILISAAKNGARISEEKVSVIYQTGSQTSTKNPISHSGEVITSLLEIVAIRSPLKFIGMPGIVLIIFGIYFAIDVTLTYNAIGYFSVPFTLIGVSCLVIGLILFLMSILLYSVSKRSKKGKNTY